MLPRAASLTRGGGRSGASLYTPQRRLTLSESAVFGCGNFGANVVYKFLNGAAGLCFEPLPGGPDVGRRAARAGALARRRVLCNQL